MHHLLLGNMTSYGFLYLGFLGSRIEVFSLVRINQEDEMEVNYNLLFLLSCLGVINSLLLALYFLYSSGKSEIQNRFLAALLFVLSIRIGKSVIFYFFESAELIDLYLQVGLSACILIGPFLYFYVHSFVNKHSPRYWWLQLSLFALIILTVTFQYPYMEHIEIWREFFLPIINLQWFIYLLMAGREIWKNRKELTSGHKGFLNKKLWLISIFSGVAIIWLAYVTTPITSYLLGAVSFSFMLYLLIFLLLTNKMRETGLESIKYGGVKVKDTEAKKVYEQLNHTLERNYQNHGLKLDNVADLMGVRKHKISQVLNESYNINFSTYLKKFRVQKVKGLIETNEQYTLEAIGKDCGFKAKSSFYTAFKKETGMTPLQYKKRKRP